MLGQVFGTSRPAVGEHEVRLRNPQLLHFLLRFHNAMVLLPIDANVTLFVASCMVQFPLNLIQRVEEPPSGNRRPH